MVVLISIVVLCWSMLYFNWTANHTLLPTLKKFSYQVTTNSPLHSSHHPSCCRLRSENPSLRSCHLRSLLVGSWSWTAHHPVQTISTKGKHRQRTYKKRPCQQTRQETFHEDWKVLCQMELLTTWFIAHPPAQAASFAGVDVRDARFSGIGWKERHPTFEALHRNHHLGSKGFSVTSLHVFLDISLFVWLGKKYLHKLGFYQTKNETQVIEKQEFRTAYNLLC